MAKVGGQKVASTRRRKARGKDQRRGDLAAAADRGKTVTTLMEKGDQVVAKKSPVMTPKNGTDPMEPVIHASSSKNVFSVLPISQSQEADAIEDEDPKDETDTGVNAGNEPEQSESNGDKERGRAPIEGDDPCQHSVKEGKKPASRPARGERSPPKTPLSEVTNLNGATQGTPPVGSPIPTPRIDVKVPIAEAKQFEARFPTREHNVGDLPRGNGTRIRKSPLNLNTEGGLLRVRTGSNGEAIFETDSSVRKNTETNEFSLLPPPALPPSPPASDPPSEASADGESETPRQIGRTCPFCCLM